MTETEVQQDVQRFTGEYFARVAQSAESLLESPEPSTRRDALRLVLAYSAAALDITAGPVPLINLFDMLVFSSLTRAVYRGYWLPAVFGEAGQPLGDALDWCDDTLWESSGKVLAPTQQDDLRGMVATWLREHPHQFRVEAVRFSDFSQHAGDAARAGAASGLLSSVKSLNRAADQALLLGERAIFFAQRAPFLMRLQGRLGAQEVLLDSAAHVRALEPLLSEARGLRPIVRDLALLSARARDAAKEARELQASLQPTLQALRPLLARRMRGEQETTALEESLGTANHLTESSLSIVRELQALARSRDSVHSATRELDRWLRRWLLYVLLVGAAWLALFWLGYYAVTRAPNQHTSAPHSDSRAPRA